MHPIGVFLHTRVRTAAVAIALLLPAAAVGQSNGPPLIVTEPSGRTVQIGDSVLIYVRATPGLVSYQWFRDGQLVAGATGGIYSIASATLADAGTYTAVVSNAFGSVTSNPAVIVVFDPGTRHLLGLSVRATAGTGENTLIVGFVVGGAAAIDPGTGTAPGAPGLLVRGMGPSLAPYGVSSTLADPQLTLFQGSTSFASNDDWSGDANVNIATGRVFAFPFLSWQSKDAALYVPLGAGVYTMHIAGAGGASGVVLAEVYDATSIELLGGGTARLLALSGRAQVGTGDGILIAGVVIGGNRERMVLIRAIGPGLTRFGISHALADPQLAIYSGSTCIATNDDWGGTAELSSTFTAVSAFALDPGSKDAALRMVLPPGPYTALVQGAGGTIGVALVEIYEVP